MSEQTILSGSYEVKDPTKWHRQDTMWMLGLFGTAIGAGVLFLPINAGIGGLWPLVIVTILAFPVTYLAHRALARFILSASSADEGITGVIGEHFGQTASKIFTVIYFLAIYTILLMYAVAVTNTTQSFIMHQLHFPEPPRAMVAIVLILGLMFIVRFGQDVIVRAMSALVYPFIASLIIMACYLIPYWNGAIFETANVSVAGTGRCMFATLWLTFPVLVLSFNHYPIISPFVVRQRKTCGDAAADGKCAQIQRNSYILMVTVVLFFVYSCILSLSPANLAEAKAQNISILSYLANHFQAPLIAYLSPVIAFTAITKSFLGHYLGAYEALRNIIMDVIKAQGKVPKVKKVDYIIFSIMVATCWFTAYKNPSILGIIENITGPATAIILLLLPMYAIHKLPALEKYRGKSGNVFITVIGLITVSALFYGMLK